MLIRSFVALLLTASAVGPLLAQSAPQTEASDETVETKADAAAGATQDAIAAPAIVTGSTTDGPTAETSAAATVSEGPAPVATTPDPLTPQQVDQGPARAPGAPERPASATAPAADAAIVSVKARLDSWSASRDGAERADLEAMKVYYADPAAQRIWTSAAGITPRAEAVLGALQRADDWGLDASAFALPTLPRANALPETLVEAEISIGLAALKYARHARGGRLDPPSLSKTIDMRPRLFEPKSVLEALAVAPAADAYLEQLNPRHAGFQALKGALAKTRTEAGSRTDSDAKTAKSGRLAGSDAERRILTNMERWRWLPDDLGAFYVWDNVPEQLTRIVHDGKVVQKERIVVGKADTPTPIFSAPMRFVIFHPSWGVPEGIKSNELGPMLKRAQSNSSGWFFSDNDGASRALRRHELKVFQGGREVNPDRVNWSSVDIRQFSFQQPPSGRNVLGVVKFRFPNKFDVYMHDTSERHLFSRSPRTFSHGCMRVENPVKFAETILAYDKGWGRDRIQQMISRGGTTDVTLDKSVPVHIVYFTASVDEDGKLHTFPDVYGVDSRVASALAGRSVVLASARSEPEAGAGASPKRYSPNKKPAQRVKTTRKDSGEPFNPFSGLFAN